MANAQNAFQVYKNASVQTATPERLLIMLYDGLLNSITIASSSIDEQRFDEANRQLIKAQNIVRELQATLKPDYEISASLSALYDYFYRQFIQANVSKNRASLDEIAPFIKSLRDAWFDASLQVMKMKESQTAF